MYGDEDVHLIESHRNYSAGSGTQISERIELGISSQFIPEYAKANETTGLFRICHAEISERKPGCAG